MIHPPLVLAAALSGLSTAAARPNDALPPLLAPVVAGDTVPPLDTAPRARIRFDFGAGATAVLDAHAMELGMNTAPNPWLRNQVIATTQLRFTRPPDSLSAALARRVGTGERIPRVDVAIPAGHAGAAMAVSLYDAQVTSSRVTSNGDDGALRLQHLALLDAVAQVGADAEEAQRQLTVTASLEKRHLASAVELARARVNTALLASRLTVQQQRLALVERQLADWTPFVEEVVLAAVRAEAAPRPAPP